LYCVQNGSGDGKQKYATKRRKSDTPAKNAGHVQPKLDATM